MKYPFALFLLIVFCLNCSPQNKVHEADDDLYKQWKVGDYRLPGVYTETESNGVVIQNSYPKGDRYPDSNGNLFMIAVFWTRVINLTAKPLELDVRFTGDSLDIPALPGSYMKLFLPKDTLTRNKLAQYGYGLTDFRLSLDARLNNPTSLKKNLKPNEELFFYVAAHGGIRSGFPQKDYVLRTALTIKERDLFYNVYSGRDSVSYPCGNISFSD